MIRILKINYTIKNNPKHLLEAYMLIWALVFFIIAIASLIIALSGIAASTTGVLFIVFYVFCALFVIFFIVGLAIRPPRV